MLEHPLNCLDVPNRADGQAGRCVSELLRPQTAEANAVSCGIEAPTAEVGQPEDALDRREDEVILRLLREVHG